MRMIEKCGVRLGLTFVLALLALCAACGACFAQANEQPAVLTGTAPFLAEGTTIVAASVNQNVEALIDASGAFCFDALPPDIYSVYVPMPRDARLAQDSVWNLTQYKDSLWLTVSLKAGSMFTLPEIMLEAVPASLSGVAYMDVDGNMTRGADEQLMTGVPLTLEKYENDAWIEFAAAMTDEYGTYRFEDLSAGEYRVLSATDAENLFVASIGASSQSENGKKIGTSIVLTAGQGSEGEADIGIRALATLRLIAFDDRDSSGVYQSGMSGVADVKVEILNGEYTAFSGLTDRSGILLLNGIEPGEYRLRITAPVGRAFTIKGRGANASCVGDTSDISADSALLFLEAGRTFESFVGLKTAASLSGTVFEDSNYNGIFDEGEPGIAGVVMHLKAAKSGVTRNAVTSENGFYYFNGLESGKHTITMTIPDGLLLTRYSATGGDMRSIFTGETTSRDYAIGKVQTHTDKNVGLIEKGVIEGAVFLDANYNGVYDEGEAGYGGVTIEVTRINSSTDYAAKLVSEKDGSFCFEGLRSGNYRIRAILPDNGLIFTLVPENAAGRANLFEQRGDRRDFSLEPFVIESGKTVITQIGVAMGATISGRAFIDEDYSGVINGSEKGLAGIEVRLIDAQGSSVQSVKTAGNAGSYTFKDVMPGDYTLQFKRKANHGFTRLRPSLKEGSYVAKLVGEYGITDSLSVTMGQNIVGVNAGMLPSSTLSGVFFHDLNDNGLKDEGEAGMTEATVRLLSEDGEIDLTLHPAADGSYFFDGIMPERYTLTFTMPQYVELANVVSGGNTLAGLGQEVTTDPFSVAMAENHQYPLIGAVTLGTFEGRVYHDANANGVPDDGEEYMANARITLRSDKGQEQSAATGDDGAFSLTELRPGSYNLTVELPEGYIFSGSVDGLNFDTEAEQSLNCPWSTLTNRKEKVIGAVKPASLRGVIWLDENKDSVRGDAEALLTGVTVELIREMDQTAVQRVISTEDGFQFNNVRPGVYTVCFLLPSQSEPADDATSTFTRDGENMKQQGIVIEEAKALNDLTTGVISRTSIGGRLLLNEGGQSSAVPGITISLYEAGEVSPLQTTVTDTEGVYRFDGLWPASYCLKAAAPSGMVFVKPDDPNYESGASVITETIDGVGSSAPFDLLMSKHRMNLDMLFIKPAKVGDLVWLDENQNGLIDGNEPRLPNVTLSLIQNGKVMNRTTTNAYGYYLFDDVYPGEYTLQAEAYPELTITTPVPKLRIISSCLTSGDGTSAQSDPFNVVSGSNNQNFDCGYVLLPGQTRPSAITAPPDKNWMDKKE